MPQVIPISARGLRVRSGFYPYTRRHIHATPRVSKSVKDKLLGAADKVNKKVGEGLATAIETGEKATEKTEKTLGATTKHAKGKKEGAKQGTDQIGQKAKEAGNDVVARAKVIGKNAPKDM